MDHGFVALDVGFEAAQGGGDLGPTPALEEQGGDAAEGQVRPVGQRGQAALQQLGEGGGFGGRWFAAGLVVAEGMAEHLSVRKSGERVACSAGAVKGAQILGGFRVDAQVSRLYRRLPFRLGLGRKQPSADMISDGSQTLVADPLAVLVGDVCSDVPHDWRTAKKSRASSPMACRVWRRQ